MIRCNIKPVPLLVSVLLAAGVASCGDISSKVLTSGSSDSGFIEYKISSISRGNAVIAVDNSATSLNRTSVTRAALSAEEAKQVIEAFDTTANILNTSYCDSLTNSFSYKNPVDYLVDEIYGPYRVKNAPYLAEKAYLQPITTYCYARKTYYLENTRINEQTSANYGKVRWYRNQLTTFDENGTFDYLMSQASNAEQTRVLSVFRQVGPVEAGGERLYGKMKLIRNNRTGNSEFTMVRYFVDDSTKNNAIPETLRQEGYAMSTSVTRSRGLDLNIHHLATYYLDYNQRDPVTLDPKLVIHRNTMVVYENWGSKVVESEYCVDNQESRSEARLFYSCDLSKLYLLGGLNERRDKHAVQPHTIRSRPAYYSDAGILIEDSRNDPAVVRIDPIVDEAKLEELKAKLAASDTIPAPLELEADLDLTRIFDTSNALDFDFTSAL